MASLVTSALKKPIRVHLMNRWRLPFVFLRFVSGFPWTIASETSQPPALEKGEEVYNLEKNLLANLNFTVKSYRWVWWSRSVTNSSLPQVLIRRHWTVTTPRQAHNVTALSISPYVRWHCYDATSDCNTA